MSTKGGWEKLRKRKAQIELKEEEIRKTRKIDYFLKPKTAVSVVSSNNVPIEITPSSVHTVSVFDNNVQTVDNDIPIVDNDVPIVDNHISVESNSSYATINFQPHSLI